MWLYKSLVVLGLVSLLAVGARAADPQSEKVGTITVREDVVYGQVHGAGLLADIAFGESKQPLPAIISVHGGRWVGGHKRDASTIKVQQWAGFGFFAMSIDYRLKNCTPAPACYQDLQCAIRFVHANAKQFNVDIDVEPEYRPANGDPRRLGLAVVAFGFR